MDLKNYLIKHFNSETPVFNIYSLSFDSKQYYIDNRGIYRLSKGSFEVDINNLIIPEEELNLLENLIKVDKAIIDYISNNDNIKISSIYDFINELRFFLEVPNLDNKEKIQILYTVGFCDYYYNLVINKLPYEYKYK